MRIEYHPASDGAAAKTPDDSVTIDLSTRRQAVYTPNDLGLPAKAKATRDLYAAQTKKAAKKAKKAKKKAGKKKR